MMLTSCVVELGLTGLTSTSRNVRRTLHVPSGVPVQCFSPERSPSYPVKLNSKSQKWRAFPETSARLVPSPFRRSGPTFHF